MIESRRRTLLFILTFLSLERCSAQVDSLELSRDGAADRSSNSSDTIVASSSSIDTGSFHPTKSPWLAVGLSAVVPGLGQLYNENSWKAPLIWGVGGYWVYEWI